MLACFQGVAPFLYSIESKQTRECVIQFSVHSWHSTVHLSQVISHWVACEVLGKFMTRFCKFGKMVFKVYLGRF